MVVPKRRIANFNFVTPSMSTKHTNERPANLADNLPWSRLPSCPSVGGPRSASPSPMDSSPPSKVNYAEYFLAQMSWLGKMAKSLSIFLFFSFILDLLHRRKCGKVSRHKCHTNTVTWQEVTASHHMMSHDESHDRRGEIVHRPCSSCISSVENLTRTPSSSPCQTLIKEQLA